MKKILQTLCLTALTILLFTGCNREIGSSVTMDYPPPATNPLIMATPSPEPSLTPSPTPEPTPEPSDMVELELIPELSSAPPVQVTSSDTPSNAIMVSTGVKHTLAITEDNTLWAWGGWGAYIGDGTNQSRVTPVAIMGDVIQSVAGETHSLAVTSDGTLWAWGQNFAGQLGDGTREKRLEPVPILQNVVYATIAPTLSNAHAIGSMRSFAITEDRSLWAWGQNGTSDIPGGFLGDGTTEDRLTPVLILENVRAIFPTSDGAFAITEDDVLWGWGSNFFWTFSNFWNQFDSNENNILAPMCIKDNVANVFVYYHQPPLVITTDGRLWLLGSEHEQITTSGRIMYAARSASNFFVILTDNSLWAWGANQLPDHWDWSPLLGDGTTEDRETPVHIMDNAIFITTVADTVFVKDINGTLWAWGSNSVGQLGVGTQGMGWATTGLYNAHLSPVRVLDNVVSISSGYHTDHGWLSHVNTFAITTDGSLWAWGGGGLHQHSLGDGSDERHPSPIRIF